MKRLLVVVGLLALVAAGCGGSATSQFASKANAACAQRDTRNGEVIESVGESYGYSSDQAAAQLAAGLASNDQQELAALRRVRPPTGQRAEFNRYLVLVDQQEKLALQAEAAAKHRNPRKYVSITTKESGLANEAHAAASKLGLPSCAAKLSAGDLAQIKHVITVTETQNFAAECTQLMTKSFVKEQFGNLATCVSVQRHPAPRTKVTISPIGGAGDFAQTVTVTSGGGSPAITEGLTLYKQGGHWRLQSSNAP